MTPEEVRAQAAAVTTLYVEGKIAKDAGEALLSALEAGACALESQQAAAEGAELFDALRNLPAPTPEQPAIVMHSRRVLADRDGRPMVSLAVGSRSFDVAFGPEETIPLPERFRPGS